jgi:hypothetical protein
MYSNLRLKSLVFAGSSLIVLSTSAVAQTQEGVCFIDVQQQGSP